jgi:mannose-6-phosphate isomerase
MSLILNSDQTTAEVFETVKNYLNSLHLSIHHYDDTRPWGGFFVLQENEAEKFIAEFFNHVTKDELSISGKLSPKILVVAPNKRLSWQYHHRRAEIWKLIAGQASVSTSNTDEQNEPIALAIGDIVELAQGQRHRLVGHPTNWGIVAEIWRHTNHQHPSDENDIVRLQDDFGR